MISLFLALALFGQVSFEQKRLATIPEDCIFEETARFSANGSTVAYIVNRGGKKRDPEGSVIDGGKYHVIVNEREGEGFFQIAGSWGLELSADGTQVAYTANLGESKCVAIVNDRKLGVEFTDSSFPSVSPDGKRIGFWARDKDRQCVVVGGKQVLHSDNPLWFLGFSPDGSTHAVLGSRFVRAVADPFRSTMEYRHFIILGNRMVGGEADWIEKFRFSPDGKTFAYVAHQKAKQHLVVGEKQGPAFEQVRKFAFSPDGTQVAYSARNGTRPRVMLGDRDLSKDYDYADYIGFSPDGKEVSFVGNQGEKIYLVAGARRWRVHGTVTWHPTVFSPDGKHVAYVAWSDRGGDYVGVGDQEGEFCDRIYTPPVFSPDGKKVAYGALKGREFWWKVLDVK